MNTRLSITVHAKINLSLEVLGQRPDGYREVRTVLQTISLADRLDLESDPSGALNLTCSRPDLATDDNLALRAARLARDAWNMRDGARLHLEKGIPVAAGLGGGSADAAAALTGLSALWNQARTTEELTPLAARLGADVPFFLTGGCALGRGRGDELEPLPAPATLWFVLLTPQVELANKTARLYRALTPDCYSSGEATAALASALRAGAPPAPGAFVNVFERVAGDLFPELEQDRAALTAAGAASVHLSGSGPTLFTTVPDETAGQAVLARLAAAGQAGMLAHTLPRAWEFAPAAAGRSRT